MSNEYRLVVAGCRDYHDYSVASVEIEKHIRTLGANRPVIIISGCASGADALGERYATEHNLPIERYPADWERYGRGAGPRRNEQMAKVADGVLVFWDGKSRGTQSMIKCAQKCNKPCQVVYINK